jgi:hypothetical protein
MGIALGEPLALPNKELVFEPRFCASDLAPSPMSQSALRILVLGFEFPVCLAAFVIRASRGAAAPSLSDHLGLDELDAAIGVADGAIAEAGLLEAWLDHVIEMGSANVENA